MTPTRAANACESTSIHLCDLDVTRLGYSGPLCCHFLVAGTGKFARESANSGWWQNAAADGKVFATKWGGNCNW